MESQAVVFPSPNKVEFRPVNCPEPGPQDTVVRVTHSWISNGTEGSYLRGERIAGDTAYREGDPIPFPIVPGYQKIGVVERVGREIEDLSVGETVFCACGKVEGMFQSWAGHIAASISSRDQIWKLPPGREPLAFAALVLTQVGYNLGSRGPIEKGQHSVVFGDGMVGQWAAQTLAWRGARVIMVGQDAWRLSLAEKLTGCRTVNMKETDWQPAVRKLASEGVAVVADAVGTREGTESMFSLMIRGGHIVSAGFCGTDDRVSIQAMRDLELSLDCVSAWSMPRMEQTLNLIARGDLKTLPLITHHFPASKVAEAWQVINGRREPVLGVILDW